MGGWTYCGGMTASGPPVRVAIVNDYELVVVGVAALLEPYSDRVQVVELDSNLPVLRDVDVILYDTFGQVQGKGVDVDSLVNGGSAKVVIYSWNLHGLLVDDSVEAGASGYLSKGIEAVELVRAIERIHAGETSCPRSGGTANPKPESDWPGKDARTDRSRGGDHRPDHPGALQPGDRRAQLPEHQLGEDLHPHGLPQDRRRTPRAGGAVGDQARLRT